jgi:hypothetical protein
MDIAAHKREALKLKKMKLMLSQRNEFHEREEEEEKEQEDVKGEEEKEKEEEERRRVDAVSETHDDMFFPAAPLFVHAAELPTKVPGLDHSDELSYWNAFLQSEEFDDNITNELKCMLAKHKGSVPELLLRLLFHLVCTHRDTQIQFQAYRVYESFLLHLTTLSVGERLLGYCSPPENDAHPTTRWVPSADDFVRMLVGQGAPPDQDLTPLQPPQATTTSAPAAPPGPDLTPILPPPICNITKTFHLVSLALDTRPKSYSLHDRQRLLLLCFRASLDPHTQSQPAVGSAIVSLLCASTPAEASQLAETLLAASSDARSRQRLLSLLPLERTQSASSALRRRGAFFLLRELFSSASLGDDADAAHLESSDVLSDPSLRDVVRLLDSDAFRTRSVHPHLAWFRSVICLSEMVASAMAPAVAGTGQDPNMKRLLELWQNTSSRVKGLSDWTIRFRDLIDLSLFRHSRLSGDSKIMRL